MENEQQELSSLDQGPPVVLQAGLELLQDVAALLQLGRVPVREGHVVDSEAPLPVDVQQGGDSVPVELCPGAEHKDLLHPLVLELLWWEKTSNAEWLKTGNRTWIFGSLWDPAHLTDISLQTPADVFVFAA